MFDSAVLAPILGFKGSHQLYRTLSCNAVVPEIQTPVFVLVAKDDPITRYKHVPIQEIKQNPNMFLCAMAHGGHIEFPYCKLDQATGKTYYSNYVENVAFRYFEAVS